MKLRTTQGFAIGAAASASLGGMAVLLAIPNVAAGGRGFAASAYLATALPALLFGTLLARLHGRPGGAFPLVVGGGLVVRLGAGCLVTALAARAGGAAIPAALAGLAAGLVPVTAFETWWFARKSLSETA